MNEKKLIEAVVFILNERFYGVETDIVEEVVPLPEINSIGDLNSIYCGMINYRGYLIPVIDLVTRLGEKRKSFELINSVVIIKTDSRLIGLVVDKLETIVTFSPKEIIAKPEVIEGMNLEYVSQVGISEGKVIFLLDINQVLGIK